MAKKNEYNNINKNPLPSSSRNSSYVSNSTLKGPVNKTTLDNTYKPNNYETKNTTIKKQTADLMTVMKTFAIVCSTAVIGVTGGLLPTGPKVEANIMELGYGDEGIFYFVTLSEYVDGVTVELYNDFTDRVNKVESVEADGFFENLAPNMRYTFAIKLGNKTLAKQTIVTRYEEYDEPYYEDYDDNDQGYYDPTTGEYYPDKPVVEDDNPDYNDPNNSDNPNYGVDGTGDNGYYDDEGNFIPYGN